MKKILSIFLLAVLIAAMIPSAWADNTDTFTIDERTVFNDMSRSYLQGYEPVISWDRLTMVIPIRSERAVGNIQAELIVANEDISPFKPQSMSARTQRVEDGLWAVRFNLNLFSDRMNGDYEWRLPMHRADQRSRRRRQGVNDRPFYGHPYPGRPDEHGACADQYFRKRIELERG